MMGENNVKDDFWKDVLGSDYVAPTEETPKPDNTPPKTEEEPKPQPKQEIKNIPTEVSNEELLKLLNARGINVDSLDKLQPQETEEQKKAKAEKRKNDILAFGLEKGKVKREDYDALLKAESNKLALVLEDVEKVIREKHPELNEADIQEKISEYTLSNLADDDILKIARQRELLELADLKLKNKYSSIYNLENDYNQYEQSEQSKYQLKRKVEAGLPVYQQDVESVIGELQKMDFTVEDKENPENTTTIPFEFSSESLKELKENYLFGEYIVSKIKNGYTKEDLKKDGYLFLIEKNLPAIVNHSAKSYNSTQKDKYINGRKGMLPKNELDISASGTSASITEKFWNDVMPKEGQSTN